MVWDEKCGSINNLLWFCRTWKSRQEIQIEFDLTNSESWNCVKYLKNLPYYVETEQNQGDTKRAYLFRTRYFEIKRLKGLLENNQVDKNFKEIQNNS